MNDSEAIAIGRQIVEGIGEQLVTSGALDHLVEKGKEPDPSKRYIYANDKVWRVGVPYFDSREDVEPGERRAVNVRPGPRGVGYAFEFEDNPYVSYRVNYGWALVEDTPENAAALADYFEGWRRIEEEQSRLQELIKSISLG